jgi:phosphatidate cytidylyltransferase
VADTGTAAPASNLLLRVVSAIVLAPIALGTMYVGGWPFTLFWAAAALAVLWEWTTLVKGPLWTIAGILYAAVMVLAPVILRRDAEYGLFAILLLFGVVWATDILGYFAGRAFGGPKLWPAVSPKKTWSGAIAGTLGAALVAAAGAAYFDRFQLGTIAGTSVLLSVVAQLGDLMESAIKRKFGAKDASHIIPGHGGVMDRLDGFWAAALVGCLIGLVRGGFDAPARGLLLW